jgi:hypothetical protein
VHVLRGITDLYHVLLYDQYTMTAGLWQIHAEKPIILYGIFVQSTLIALYLA